MERLTEHTDDGYIAIKGCASVYPAQERKRAPATSAIVRLAAYEDSGLTPEEVAELVKIVRCKNCKHHVYYSNEERKHWCYRRTDCFPVDENGFCSFGEMKGE